MFLVQKLLMELFNEILNMLQNFRDITCIISCLSNVNFQHFLDLYCNSLKKNSNLFKGDLPNMTPNLILIPKIYPNLNQMQK